jgi:hypothetical protein
MVNGYEDVERISGDVANTYEYMFDINTGTAAVPVWLNIPEITALNPAFAPKLKDIATYADQGSSSQKKVGADFTLDFNLLKIRDLTGEFQDYWIALKEAADADGDANNLGFRYYDSKGASDAYQGIAAVNRGSRPSTANDDPGWDNFSLAGKGPVRPIVNPLKAAA